MKMFNNITELKDEDEAPKHFVDLYLLQFKYNTKMGDVRVF